MCASRVILVTLACLALQNVFLNAQARSLNAEFDGAPSPEEEDLSSLVYSVELPESDVETLDLQTLANAPPRPMPSPPIAPPPMSNLTPVFERPCLTRNCNGFVPGAPGNKASSPAIASADNYTQDASNDELSTAAYGTLGYPYSTAGAFSTTSSSPTNLFPWRAAGKLFMTFGTVTYVCSASLIRPGLVVTAAHCIADYGKTALATNVRFIPAYYDSTAPYGLWTVSRITVPAVYTSGTDSCQVAGTVCENDLAVLTLNPSSTGAVPGTTTGYFSYGWGNTGYSPSFKSGVSTAQLTQLGYPVALSNGERMIRNDAPGVTQPYNQVQLGSAQTGGSSGGPWILNFGAPYSSASTFNKGIDSNPNIVMGTTSWGYVDGQYKVQGASRFNTNSKYPTTPNIVALVTAACNALSTTDRAKICAL